MKRRFWFTFALAAALVLGSGSIVLAESPEDPPTAEEKTETAVEALPIYGMQAWIDAETGDLRAPTASEAAEMSAKWREIFGKAKAEPRMFRFKSGMMAAELDPSMFKYSVVRVDADGHLESGCAHGTDNALEFIEAAPTTSGPEEK